MNIYKKVNIGLGILLILFIGAYFGASYADTNWKQDMNNFADNHQQFKFDESGKYYTISSFTQVSMSNYSEIQNITIVSITSP
jgi:hypothetical protein